MEVRSTVLEYFSVPFRILVPRGFRIATWTSSAVTPKVYPPTYSRSRILLPRACRAAASSRALYVALYVLVYKRQATVHICRRTCCAATSIRHLPNTTLFLVIRLRSLGAYAAYGVCFRVSARYLYAWWRHVRYTSLRFR